MKLYTDEQVKRAVINELKKFNELSGLGDKLSCQDYAYIGVLSAALNHLTPIELPGEEEIEKAAWSYSNLLQNPFNDGANWVISKIKEQIK